jgi:Uma2 family endonuclease
MASQTRPRVTPEEYLAMERRAEFKSEYIDGYVYAMGGASESHNLIVTNLVTQLSTQLRNRPCKVYPSDLRVDVRENRFYAYPDVTVVCGEAIFRDEQTDNLLNPTVIIEVLSDSTEVYDRGVKFARYRRIDSLVEYVLVAQDRRHIEHYVRQSDGQWLFSEATDLQETVHLRSIDCHLVVEDVYDKVDIP